MLTWVVVTSSTGKPIAPDAIEPRLRLAAAAAPLGPTQEFRWASRSGRIVFSAWDRTLPTVPSGPCVDVHPGGLAALLGTPLEPGNRWTTGAWLKELHTRVDVHGASAVAAPLRGPNTIVHLCDVGQGEIVSDPLGCALIFVGRTRDLAVASNRPACIEPFLADTVGSRLARDVAALSWLVLLGNIVGHGTAHQGIELVPFGRRLVVEDDGELSTQPAPDPCLETQPVEAFDSLVSEALTELQAITWTLAGLDAPLRIGLTGGRDSRLVLAALAAQDLASSVGYMTMGAADSPDVIVARELATMMDLDHRVIGVGGAARARSDEWLIDRLAVNQYLSCGLAPAKDLGWDGAEVPHLLVDGAYGELMRCDEATQRRIDTWEDLDGYLIDRVCTSRKGGICRPDVELRYLDALRSMVASTEADNPGDALHRFYVEHVSRRWLGTNATLAIGAPRMHPLYVLAGARAAMAIGHEGRRSEVIPFRLTRELSPALAEYRFANKGWHPLANGGEPVPSALPLSGSGHPAARKGTSVTNHRQVFIDLLLQGGPIDEIIDVPRVRALLLDGEEITPALDRQLYNAAGVSLWLRNEERPPPA
jgi:hypothetical protein